ncbi:MAG TPA: dihydrolipoamide acetyltransferase family protein [Dehalococcoidia bacterium]|nr:dihydrolipoamide acetyltransferase family protein [Dehalococcoidia bacterium]
MATEVLVPKLGMTMTEGTVAEWLIPDGGEVKQGEIVYRLETEKINFEVEAEQAGTVRQLVPEGTVLPPGAVVAYILAPGEPLPAGVNTAPTAAGAAAPAASATATAPATPRISLDGGRVPASPIARRLAKEAGLDLGAIPGSGPGGRITEQDVIAAKIRPPAPAAGAIAAPPREVIASPLARRLAEQLGVDLATVPGSGPGGRITKEDVEQAAAHPPAPAVPTAAPAARPQPAGGRHAGEIVPLRGMRKVIAERMHASLQEMAQLTVGAQVVMDEAIKLRTQLIEEWADEGIRPSYTDLAVKAVAKALARHPLLNARVGERGIELLEEIDVGVAVALDDGLVVPVVRHADQLSLKQIAQETARLAAAARSGRLQLDEMAGGSFSITSLGMYDVDFFTPIINPPNVAILGVGRIHDATAWEGDRPFRRSELTLSLTIDHRAVDGAPAAEFLRTLRDLLQAPYRLLV